MKHSREIYDELKEFSAMLAGMEKTNVFSVPEGYFDMLYMDVLKKIQAVTSPEAKLSVPEGYFEGLADSILNKIRSLQDDPAKELRSLSPMLYSIQNENVFTVPKGYFNDLESEIMAKLKPKAKVITFRKKDSIWKYAAAAVVTGIIGLSALMNMNSSKQNSSGDGQVTITSSIKDASKFKNEKQIDEGIASLSDDEIIKYLENTGNDVDSELLSSSVDATTLPTPADYMMDEKILDTYLDQSDKSSQN